MTNTRIPQRKAKRRLSTAQILIITLVIAAVAVGAVFAAIWFSGLRYIKKDYDDGSFIKFFGIVDDNGEPMTGRLYFSSGGTAEVNMEEGKVEYSNGDVYTGALSDMLKNGSGTITFASGDSYTGDFLNDTLTGSGEFKYANGDVYTGAIADGKRQGYGVYTWSDDSV